MRRTVRHRGPVEPELAMAPVGVWPVRFERVLARPLRIRVRGRALLNRPELRVYAEERARCTLDHLARRVDCMAITVSPVDLGPERGALRCQIWAGLTNGRQLREKHTSPDPYAAIDEAVEALARDIEYLESRLPPGTAYRCA